MSYDILYCGYRIILITDFRVGNCVNVP